MAKTLIDLNIKLKQRLTKYLEEHKASQSAVINVSLGDFLKQRGY